MISLKESLEVLWLQPYLEAVEDLVPIKNIKEIKFVKYRNKFPIHHATIEKKNKNNHKIILRVYYPKTHRHPMRPLDQELCLNSLCHELSHLIYWVEASAARFQLETQIYARFGNKLWNSDTNGKGIKYNGTLHLSMQKLLCSSGSFLFNERHA